MLLKILSFALHIRVFCQTKFFAKQVMSILRILCYNGSLVILPVVSLTTAKFKPGFVLFYAVNMSILVIFFTTSALYSRVFWLKDRDIIISNSLRGFIQSLDSFIDIVPKNSPIHIFHTSFTIHSIKYNTCMIQRC
jgi:hypothetical protein